MKRQIKLKLKILRGKLIARLLGNHRLAVIAKGEHGLFAVDPQDFGVAKQLLQHGNYSESEITRLERFITPGSYVMVVGAHVGSLVIPLSKLCKKIIAIEASPVNYDLLTINLRVGTKINSQF